MQLAITHIHHNCFVLHAGDRTYLFDYPDDPHLPEGAGGMVRDAVADTDLVVFISHGHDDHLNDDLTSVTATAASVRYVFSDDVEDLRPEAIPTGAEVLVVEPDERYEWGGMVIETLMSNDLGVAFLVRDGAFRFYYGGDLAKWIWKSASPQEADFTTNFFREAMERVRVFKPHVAFSNVDKRLENLAGGPEAYRETGAQVFVPMHTFGDTGWLPSFRDLVGEGGPELFIYAEPGESKTFAVDIPMT